MSALTATRRLPWPKVARPAAGTALLVVALSSPWFGIPSWNVSVAVTALIFGIAATAVNLTLGFGGLLNLGAAFFMGLAGYGEALAYSQLRWPLLPAALLSIVATMVIAVPLGLILVRLPRFYFAVATLGLSVALQGVLAALPNVTGGESGITHARSLSFGFFQVSSVFSWYLLTVVVVGGVVLVARRVTRGKPGRLLALAREDELAANVLGVNVFRARLRLFVLAAGILAVAGVLIFPWQGVIVPENAGLVQSVLLLGSAVVGGMGVLIGGFIGAGLLTWLQTLVSSFGNYESLIYGLAYLGVVFYLNPGVGGTMVWAWRRLWGWLDAKWPPAMPVALVTEGLPPRGIRLPAGGYPSVHERGTQQAHGDGLQVSEVVRRFGGVRAVSGVTIAVPRGAVVGLIGPNGAGKSTLLNLISGVELLDGGRVLLDGIDIGGRSPAHRAAMGVARTFQTPRLVDEMSVLENVMVGIEALSGTTFRGPVADEELARSMATEALQRAGLEGLAQRRAASLGSGERKFVELIRSLAGGPSVLLMDEPGVGLSAEELMTLQGWVRELAADATAVLLVDHNMDFIGSLVDKVYVMEMGSVAAEGHPDEVHMVSSRRSGMSATLGLGVRRPGADPGAISSHRADRTDATAAAVTRAPARLDITDLRSGYGRLTVLHDTDLHVAAGEALGVFGPNGAGKTTLLATIAGLLPKQSGTIALDGEPIDTVPAHVRVAKGIALVPEGRQVIGSLSVKANLDVMSLARGRLTHDAEHQRRLSEVLDMFPSLVPRLKLHASSLSGGEQQMLAIARALMCKPSVLLLDEPSQGLAPTVVESLAERLSQIKGEVTMVLVEQSDNVLLDIVDRRLRLRLGRVESATVQDSALAARPVAELHHGHAAT